MKDLTGCCGFKCYTCAAYEGNIHSEEDRKAVCDKWKQYFDYEIDAETMHCSGCRTYEDKNAPLIHADCHYRSCAMEKGLQTCRACNDYPCGRLADYYKAYKAAYESMKEGIKPGDEEGYFLTYIVE